MRAPTPGAPSSQRELVEGEPYDDTQYQNLYLGRVGLLATFSPEHIARIAFWRETKDQRVLIATANFAPHRNIADARSQGIEGPVLWQSPGPWVVFDASSFTHRGHARRAERPSRAWSRS